MLFLEVVACHSDALFTDFFNSAGIAGTMYYVGKCPVKISWLCFSSRLSIN